MSKPTPGPWTIWEFQEDEHGCVEEGQGYFSIVTPVDPAVSVRDEHYVVADIRNRRDTALADARLCAAAPELLAACRALVRATSKSQIEEAIIMAEDAITKATTLNPTEETS